MKVQIFKDEKHPYVFVGPPRSDGSASIDDRDVPQWMLDNLARARADEETALSQIEEHLAETGQGPIG